MCKQAWFHRACIRVGVLPSPRGHGWCSAAASPAHAHAHACASPAETRPARCHHAFLLPRLRRQKAIPIPNDHAGDPNSNQVGVLLPGSADAQAQVLCLPTNCPGRPSPLPSCKHRSQLHGAAGNELKEDERGCPGSASRLGHRGLISFPLFSGRRPSWWDDAAYQSLRERHRRCDASMCLYRGGRERAEEKG